jgi:hypothetical protein
MPPWGAHPRGDELEERGVTSSGWVQLGIDMAGEAGFGDGSGVNCVRADAVVARPRVGSGGEAHVRALYWP